MNHLVFFYLHFGRMSRVTMASWLSECLNYIPEATRNRWRVWWWGAGGGVCHILKIVESWVVPLLWAHGGSNMLTGPCWWKGVWDFSLLPFLALCHVLGHVFCRCTTSTYEGRLHGDALIKFQKRLHYIHLMFSYDDSLNLPCFGQF